jgi:hypothetical protein
VGSILWGIKLFSSLSEAPKVGFFVLIEKKLIFIDLV